MTPGFTVPFPLRFLPDSSPPNVCFFPIGVDLTCRHPGVPRSPLITSRTLRLYLLSLIAPLTVVHRVSDLRFTMALKNCNSHPMDNFEPPRISHPLPTFFSCPAGLFPIRGFPPSHVFETRSYQLTSLPHNGSNPPLLPCFSDKNPPPFVWKKACSYAPPCAPFLFNKFSQYFGIPFSLPRLLLSRGYFLRRLRLHPSWTLSLIQLCCFVPPPRLLLFN